MIACMQGARAHAGLLLPAPCPCHACPCSVYGVGRGLKLAGLHFKNIVDCIATHLPDHEHDPWDTLVEIRPAVLEPEPRGPSQGQGAQAPAYREASPAVYGDVRTFYSECFVRRLEGEAQPSLLLPSSPSPSARAC